ncbi:MAG: hypothetical protein EXS09_11940 [Gemmataceae bacterium]|nr:hypothetical protein [Gemmataceae bacterium]
MRMLASFVLFIGLAAFLAAPSSAQQRQPGGRQFGGAQGGFASLLRNEGVQKELKMEKEQTEKVTEATKKITDKHADAFTKLRDLEAEERRTKSAELTKVVSEETLTAVTEILKPEQVKRLKQIELQRAGVAAFTRADVEKALSIKDEQKTKFKAISEESTTKMRELSGFGAPGTPRPARPAPGAGRGPDQTKITALRKEMNEKAMAVCTDDQKKAFKELTGEAFEVPATPRTAPKKKDD